MRTNKDILCGSKADIRPIPALLTASVRTRNAFGSASTDDIKRGTQPDTIVVDEATGLPYKEGTYRHWVGEVRRAAVHGVVRLGGETVIADPATIGDIGRLHNQIEWLLPAMPECADKRDQP